MQIQCPHCQVAIELVDVMPGSEVTCPKCGSRVSSEPFAILTEAQPADEPSALAKTQLFHAPDAVGEPKSDAASAEKSNATVTKGERYFGRFRLMKQLGKGSFGEVWRAHDPTLQREVAIKFPRPGKQKDFLREAEAAARLRHPNIVTVFEVGEASYNGRDKWPYIASELIHGRDLAEVLKSELEQGHALTPKQVADLCRQVAEALHAAHEAGVIHRDLKPANILVKTEGSGVRDQGSEQGAGVRDQGSGKTNTESTPPARASLTPDPRPLIPYLTDFGMAKSESEAGYVQSVVGDIFGSPAYMSPEQTRDSHAVDRRTDIWALGIILFELLTGERPFRGERDQKLLLDQIRSEDPPPPSQLNSQVPADLDTLCLKCLEKDPSRRFPTAAALAQELHRFLHGEPIHSRPITQWERARKWCQRKPTVAALSAAVVIVLLES